MIFCALMNAKQKDAIDVMAFQYILFRITSIAVWIHFVGYVILLMPKKGFWCMVSHANQGTLQQSFENNEKILCLLCCFFGMFCFIKMFV